MGVQAGSKQKVPHCSPCTSQGWGPTHLEGRLDGTVQGVQGLLISIGCHCHYQVQDGESAAEKDTQLQMLTVALRPDQAGTPAVSHIKSTMVENPTQDNALVLLTRSTPGVLPISSSSKVLPGELRTLRTGQLCTGFLQESTHHLQGRHREQDQN